MDPILATTAPAESFAYVDHFFRGDFDADASCRTDNGAELKLDPIDVTDDFEPAREQQAACGPIMRAAMIHNDHLIIRYWAEGALESNGATRLREFIPDRSVSHVPIVCADLEHCCAWIDASYRCDVELPSYSWPQRLRALSKKQLPDCHFIVASCWYPGTSFDRGHSAQTFYGMDSLLRAGEPCDALFLVGDQIYADAMGGLFDSGSWRDRYLDRYYEAFRHPAARTVLSKIPTHFTIDDHEIANDFAGPSPRAHLSGPRTNRKRKAAIHTGGVDQLQLDFAKMAARSYLGSARDVSAFGASSAPVGALWYALDHDREFSCPAFVMDTRSERELATAEQPARLIGESQMQAVLDWLSQVAADPRPKFIFMGTVIAPIEMRDGQDSLWMREDGAAGYPRDLGTIIDHIIEQEVQRVVFVAGDLHLSCYATMTLHRKCDDRKIAALQIVASALYAPLNFVNTQPEDIAFGHRTTLAAGSTRIEYVPHLVTTAQAHFVKVSAVPESVPEQDQWTINIAAHDPAGGRIGETFSIAI